MNDSQTSTFANNIMWKMIDLISRKAFGFAISILLARLLMPESFGVIALTTVFIAFTNIFILNGFNVSLIRKAHVEKIDYSTVMTMSLSFVTIINFAIFFLAPYVADFYGINVLCPVLRVMVFGLYFSAVSAVVSAKATRELKFKQMAIPSFTSNALGGVIAVVIAYMGGGVWALVAQHIIASFVIMIWMIILFRFPLSLKFSWDVVRGHLNFSLGVIGTSFLEFLGNHVSSLIIGKVYKSKGLGFYDRAGVLPEMISINLAGAISSVLLPTLAKHQEDLKYVKGLTRKTVSLSFFIIVPVMFGLIGCANIFVPVLLTEKWCPMIPLLYITCVYYAIAPVRTIEYGLLYSMGRSDFAVKVECLRALLMIIGIIVVAIVIKLSIFYVVLTNLLVSFVVSISVHFYVKKIISYSFKEFFYDLMPSLFYSVLMMVMLMIMSKLLGATWISLLSQIIMGALLYFLMSFIAKDQNLIYLKKLIK